MHSAMKTTIKGMSICICILNLSWRLLYVYLWMNNAREEQYLRNETLILFEECWIYVGYVFHILFYLIK